MKRISFYRASPIIAVFGALAGLYLSSGHHPSENHDPTELASANPSQSENIDPSVALDSKIFDESKEDTVDPASNHQAAEPEPESPLAFETDPATQNDQHFPLRPLDRLEVTESVAEEWAGGIPSGSGWYSRTRIVKTSFKSGLVRIEEQVEVKVDAGEVDILRTVIERAMDARHLLVSSRHAAELSSNGIPSEQGRNPNYLRVQVDDPLRISSLPLLANRLEKLEFDGVEADRLIEASQLSGDPLVGSGAAWHLDNLGLLPGHRAGADINASAAWEARTDASNILIAVIDSGISSSDPELGQSSHFMPGETIGDGIDNDGNGYIDDVLGYDFLFDDPNPEDEYGHGSACAALIAAAGNNGLGSAGVAWKASILNCRFLDHLGLGTLSDAIDAIDYARNADAKILNLSWSYSGDAPLLTEALTRCDDEGILMVCASGNAGSASPVPAPASIDLPHLVALAATTPADTLAAFSVVDSDRIALAAPGVDLPIALSPQTWNPSGRVFYVSGTSFSAALVSGGLALGLAEFPLQSPLVTLQRMLESVDPIAGGAAAMKSGGRLNLGRFLTENAGVVPHDSFADRRVIEDASGQWSGRNEGAGIEALDIGLGIFPLPIRTLWFEWTAASDGLLRINASSANGIPAALAILENVENAPGVLLSRSMHGEVLEIPVIAGEKLFWMVDSAQPISTGIHLTWHLPPPNDNWINATPIQSLPLVFSGNSSGATVESFEFNAPHHRYLPQGSIWWKWTSNVTGVVRTSVSANHAVFMASIDSKGAPRFSSSYESGGFHEAYLPVVAGASYAIVAIPLTPSAAGPCNLAITSIEGISILVQPSDVSTLPGEAVVLAVQTAGHAYPTYQWFRNDEPIPFATGSYLKLNPISGQSFARYHVVVSNGPTSVESEPAIVSKRDDKPRLIGQSPRKSVVTGQSIDLSATFRSASVMTFSWKKNGLPIAGAESSIYYKSAAVPTDSGTYSVTATNSIGSTTTIFLVDVVATPWKGWVDRTPGGRGSGAIRQVSLNGNLADAFTATEWLRSGDAGQSWTATPMPAGFQLVCGAAEPDGSALASGYSTDSYQITSQSWRFTPTSGWERIHPQFDPGDGSPPVQIPLNSLHFFDGEWWALSNEHTRNLAVHSSDGIHWTPLADASSYNGFLRAVGMFRYEDRLAVSYWDSTPGASSKQLIALRSPGGGSRILNFTDDTRNILKLGNSIYSSSRFPGVQKITEDQPNPTTLPGTWTPYLSGFTEGTRDGVFFYGLDSSSLVSGIHETTFTKRQIGHSTFAKSGDRWLVGYPDGQLWVGTDLREIPTAAGNRQIHNRGIKAYRGEFHFGSYHSSDGARWQLTGAAAREGVYPITQGDAFLHSISNQANWGKPELSLADSIYPNAKGRTNDTILGPQRWSGSTGLLITENSTARTLVQLITKQSQGVLVEEVDLGINWNFILSAAQINGHWFVEGLTHPGLTPFLITSADGRNWQPTVLPAVCSVSYKDGGFIAMESPTRGYTSPDGLNWTPFTPQGLPALNQINQPARPTSIASYRGYFVAQFDKVLYASPDGIQWSLASPPLSVEYLAANDHSLLVACSSGIVFQPGGETASGPWIELPEIQTSVSVPRHQGFRYELTVGDADGDLTHVNCLLNGEIVETRTSAPFTFHVNPANPGLHAVEFAARDATGRISRVTSKLEVTPYGVAASATTLISSDLSSATYFKGSYYRIHQGAVCLWDGGSHWQPVSSSFISVSRIIATSQALMASGPDGLLVSNDGISWTNLGGFGAAIPNLRKDTFEIQTQFSKWNSVDGFDWSPATGAFHGTQSGPGGAVWANDHLGILRMNNEIHMSYNGGRDWMPIVVSQDMIFGVHVPLENGFLFYNSTGIYRILHGEVTFTRLYQEHAWPPKLHVNRLDGLVFIGEAGNFLHSTRDGVQLTHHSPPPNRQALKITRHDGHWIASSTDRICASADLLNWRTLFDFNTVFPSDFQITNASLTIGTDGADLLAFRHSSSPTTRFILGSDLKVRQVQLPQQLLPEVPTVAEGLLFKNRHVAYKHSLHTKPVDSDDWKWAPLFPSPGFVQPMEHSWPTTASNLYSPGGPHAATRDRLIIFRKDNFNIPYNYVLTSDDGENFQIHHWSGPIPLSEIENLAASGSTFLATATQGRVLLTTDGLDWSVHQVDPNLSIGGILHFNGNWHITGRRPIPVTPTGATEQGEVWTSSDGVAWTRTSIIPYVARTYTSDYPRSFVAHGVAWMYAANIGWLNSSDGLNWQPDSILPSSFAPRGGHSEGIIGQTSNDITIFDPVTQSVVRRIDDGDATLNWLGEIPFFSSAGRFTEWIEEDPRLIHASSTAGVFGVGDLIEITVTTAEIIGNPAFTFSLTTDRMIGNEDDLVLGSFPWQSGIPQAGDDVRSFRLLLPPSITPGRFMVAARFASPGRDISLQNNQIVSDTHAVEIPGFNLRLSTSGSGSVDTSDPRVIYPQGARIQLQAVPGIGHTFQAWNGSLVSSQASISVLMNGDQNLNVTFVSGIRVLVRTIGHGNVQGGQSLGLLQPGDRVHLSQAPAPGWMAAGWSIDGTRHSEPVLHHQPTADTVIESRFIPDFHSRRTAAFSSAPPGTDTSWSADPDGDGLTNWQEILLSTDPLVSQPIASRVVQTADYLRLVFTRPQGPAETPWVKPEFSQNLTSWEPADSIRLTERILSVADGIETVEVTLPYQSNENGFFRLSMPAEP